MPVARAIAVRLPPPQSYRASKQRIAHTVVLVRACRALSVLAYNSRRPLCNLALARRTLRRRRVHVRLNKIEFSYLNSNLMVLKLHPLTLNSDRNSHNGGPQRPTTSLQS